MSYDYSTVGKTSSYLAAQQASSTSKNNTSLNQEDFLSLLTTQLTNQDPTSPVDNNQMVTTMSQLSIVDNLNTISSGMDNIVNAISSSSALSASSLVGRSVLVNTNKAYFDGSNAFSAKIAAGEGASDVKIQIKDATGSVISSYEAGALEGDIDFAWDGVADEKAGTKYPAGFYTIEVTGVQNGENVSLATKTYANVSSVVLGTTTADTKLNLIGYGEVSLSDVEQISA